MPSRQRRFGSLVLALGLVGAACGGGGAEPGMVSADAGKDLFEERVVGSNPGCVTCHSRDPDTRLVGPSLAGVGAAAADRVAGLDAGAYLRQSILDPDAYVVDGFPEGQMPATWSDYLSDVQVGSLVAYLETLR